MTITARRAAAQPTPRRSRPLRDGARPRWERPALLALLVGTAVLYLWGLGSSGWANDYYAAAAQAGTQDWKAWLFGSLDAGNAITVDKPPAATVGDGAVRQAVRLQRVHHAVAAGVDGCRPPSACCMPRFGACSGPGRGPDRGCGAGADAGRGVDVPVQQPRRAAGAAAGGGGVLHGAGDRARRVRAGWRWPAARSVSRS